MDGNAFAREATLQLTLKLFDKYDYRELIGPLPSDYRKISVIDAAKSVGQAYKTIYQAICEAGIHTNPKQSQQISQTP